jgi:Fe-S cluster assembly protein SufD
VAVTTTRTTTDTRPAPEAEAYREAFERQDGAAAPWLRDLRDRAFARFARLGFPTTRDEAWRFTSVAPIARTAFQRPEPQPLGPPQLARLAALSFAGTLEGPLAVFVNGRFNPDLSSRPSLPGLSLRSLREVLASEPGRLEGTLGGLAGADGAPFVALNTAFADDGAVVEIAPGAVVADPVHVIYLSTPRWGHEATISHPRTLVFAGRGSDATLIETCGGLEGEAYFTNAVTEIRLEGGARLDHYKLQRESDRAFHVASLAVRQERDALFSDHFVCLGGSLVRQDVEVLLDGEGAECVLNGLFMAGGQQHMDTHTHVHHARPHGTSRELYKGVLDGRSRGVFHGKVLVGKDAQKTDAYQTNKNLLLSREALVHSTPALEIFADDVKCKHGSTTGQLDPEALFYLRSRGLGEQAARSLLIYAFASDLVARFKVPAVKASLEAFLKDRLPQAPDEEVA